MEITHYEKCLRCNKDILMIKQSNPSERTYMTIRLLIGRQYLCSECESDGWVTWEKLVDEASLLEFTRRVHES